MQFKKWLFFNSFSFKYTVIDAIDASNVMILTIEDENLFLGSSEGGAVSSHL